MSDVLVKPAFQSAAIDSGDATKLGPNAWNASRLFSAGNTGDVLVRDPVSQTGASWVSTVPVAQGGTGIGSYAIGDLLYASASGTLAKLADVAAGSVLVSGGVGVAPAWSSSPTIAALTVGTSAAIIFGTNGAFVGGADGQFVYRNNANTNSISFAADRVLLNHSAVGNAIVANGAGIFLFSNEAQTIGFTLNGGTADVCKIRNRANSGYATMDALGYSVSGVAGASKVAGPVTSITVVNGIVTACS